MNNITESVEPSCNLQFIDPNIIYEINNNVATVTVGYFIENAGSIDVTDVFNYGTIQFANDIFIDNISSNDENINISIMDETLVYSGNLGGLVPGETLVVSIQFDIIGVREHGEYIVSNITNVTDGEGDNITYAEDIFIDVVQLTSSVEFYGNRFDFIINNESSSELRFDFDASITLPPNVSVIFRNFGAFSAKYINTNYLTPVNQILSGPNVVQLRVERVLMVPFATIILSVYFDLISSSQIGNQFIVAQIDSLRITNQSNFIIIDTLANSNNTSIARAQLTID